jgi:hypothetical protein
MEIFGFAVVIVMFVVMLIIGTVGEENEHS